MSDRIHTLKVLDMVPHETATIKNRFYELRLEPPGWSNWSPGQFAMLRPAAWGGEQTWSKPISICSVNDKGLVFFFQVSGHGTRRLAQVRPGDDMIVVGPLGSKFAVYPDRPTLMLAGGMGLAPFVGYSEAHPNPGNLKLLFGHRLPLECYLYPACACKLGERTCRHENMNDEESFMAVLEENIAALAPVNGLALACGPGHFLRKVQEFSLKHGVDAQVSLESRMACGIGACLGCVVKPLLDEATGKNRSSKPQPKSMHQDMPAPVCACGPVFWVDSFKF
ncbi:MAG: dihydroorotate dehydrogenase electron transfer subunit [Deltaproteobacteria bacterium]|jgi:dihydroorotate dehydrogenase electron transfer subunit|nr:dihydroorotate dehydrogenase electron transfer subunit [Deltaproteobacteria bacterium]